MFNKYAVSEKHINQRQFLAFPAEIENSNFTESSFDENAPLPLLYPDLATNPKGDGLTKRMLYYRKKVNEAFERFFDDNISSPSDIVHVTCAGYLSPSPAQELVSKKKWGGTQVTHCYHMGCYAAFPAVRIASGITDSSPLKIKTDVVHTEFLSTHFEPTVHAENIINMTLFADGFIKYTVFPEDEFKKLQLSGLKLIGQHEELISDTLEDMSWIIGNNHFDMHLSANVPDHVGKNVLDFSNTLCSKSGLKFSDVKDKLVYAIHPGGPKILRKVKEALGLDNEHVRLSSEILRQHGNMSSATVPHIWKEIIESDEYPNGTLVLSMGFGPGLTATGYIFEKCSK